MNNNNILKDLKYKVFNSGNPLYFYIGVNTLVFLVVGIASLALFLSGSHFNMSALVREWFGLPAALGKLPERFYTIFTYMVFHDGIFHLLFNMLGLYWFGQIFLNFAKSRQFHFIYLVGGLAGAVFYIIGLNVFPVFANSVYGATVIGSSAAVMAIVMAAATLMPDYTLFMMFLGPVKIKYLALGFLVLDVLGIASTNAGGSFAHIGGALFGFFYIKSLQKGSDWSKILERKPKLKVVKNDRPIVKKRPVNEVSQKEIDAILDKISTSGYDKLTANEKEQLFKASKN
ncbi:membrane associated rhomboid family serine protease [Pedobacter sp. UYP30]|uniref:rhomboid family intramembrane serine protease n=1 Tax=Pedobacter sp. UYP30 TaxID=1756400 RepID=UPI003398D3F8